MDTFQPDNFAELLAWARTNRPASVQTITIPLDNARTDELKEVAGLLIYVENATDANVSLQIKHNEISSGLITLTKSYGAVFPFYRLFLTNTAQAGKTITLTISQASPFQIIDNRSGQDMLSVLTNIKTDADNLPGILTALGNTLASWTTTLANWVTELAQTLAIKNNTRSLNGDTGTQVGGFVNRISVTTDIYQVTTGKTLYLKYLQWSTTINNNAADAFDIAVTDAANNVQYYLVQINAEISSAVGTILHDHVDFSTPIKIPSQYKIRVIRGAASLTINALCRGWEE